MILNNKVYNILKYILMYVVPPATALIGGLGVLYDVPTDKLVTTITLVATFVAAVTGVSQHNYNKEDGTDGQD